MTYGGNMSTIRHKAGNTWAGMNQTDRANWLAKSGLAHTGWARESWYGLPESIRAAFIDHCLIVREVYAWQ